MNERTSLLINTRSAATASSTSHPSNISTSAAKHRAMLPRPLLHNASSSSVYITREPGLPLRPSTSMAATIAAPSSFSSSLTRSCADRLDTFFCIHARDSTITQEIRSGCVTFVTMAYILIVNAQILSSSGPSSTHGHHMNFDSIVAATAISAAIGSGLVGLWGNLPFGLAPGMGLNSYFTYGICLRLGISWHIALTCCFMQGLLLTLLSLLGTCDLIQLYTPPCIKKSITVGLGLFQALIGYEMMKLVIPGRETLLSIGDFDSDGKIYLSLAGLVLISILFVWRVKAAILVGITCITVASWMMRLTKTPESIVEMPHIYDPFHSTLDFHGYFHHLHHTIPITLVMLFVSILDTAGVQHLCGEKADLLDENGILPSAKAAFCSAGIATTIGAAFGTSPIIIHNETIAGITDGARTGLHSVTVAFLFLLSIPFVPILRAVPPIAAAPPLIIVGVSMMSAAKFIDWEKTHEAIPAFLCATILPFTYSIANGMVMGIVAYGILKSTHKLGEWIAPQRFKEQEKEEQQQDQASLNAVITYGEGKGGNGTSESTPKRVHREIFEDRCMPGGPQLALYNSSPLQTRVSHPQHHQQYDTVRFERSTSSTSSASEPARTSSSAGNVSSGTNRGGAGMQRGRST